MQRRIRTRILITAILALFLLSGYGQITMPRFFSDHMVLKSDTTTAFWGWAQRGQPVFVKASWMEDTIKTVALGTAKWKIDLPTAKAGGPYKISVICRNDTLVLNDVLLGEVWICSGQSNMQRSAAHKLPQMLDVLHGPFNNKVRILNVRDIASETPQDNIYDMWQTCDSVSLRPFSAIAYFFAQKVSQTLDVPVGVINASWGGTCAEVWLPAGEVLTDSFLSAKSRLQKLAPFKPHLPGQAWNSMIYPFVGYGITGALWYQGENNTVSWDGYARLFSKLINSWHRKWKKDFPFYFAQIAPYNYKNKGLQRGALVREAQNQVSLSVENAAMVLTSDLVNNINDIHPILKKEVAIRMADLALVNVYHAISKNPYSPILKSYTIEKNRIIISFHYMDHEKLEVHNGDIIHGLYIAGKDRKFLPASYKIDGNKLIVFNPSIQHPVSVRYAFSDTTLTNLYSSNGLPVSLFRLDNWNQPTK
ncbi:sialate O-acetylesterase [Arachidicoccus terrestris]|uniref:sialate O-acetylesterase n=1 Tax=Arachidicoccus terrestris TaxID=2875539 RepID=UPI001CC64440|nr:sialate O-acetylesterase [Arachidicoccus terrestris]UAY56951.1 sialate O-acetylesterase [Arachidicoccus terrestris]